MRFVAKRIMLLGLVASFAPLAVHAQSDEEAVRNQLSQQGYENIRFNRTMLGRMRFVADRGGFERELVVTLSGIVLRDVTKQTDAELPEQDIDGGNETEASSDGQDDDDENDGDDNDNGGDDDRDENDD